MITINNIFSFPWCVFLFLTLLIASSFSFSLPFCDNQSWTRTAWIRYTRIFRTYCSHTRCRHSMERCESSMQTILKWINWSYIKYQCNDTLSYFYIGSLRLVHHHNHFRPTMLHWSTARRWPITMTLIIIWRWAQCEYTRCINAVGPPSRRPLGCVCMRVYYDDTCR